MASVADAPDQLAQPPRAPEPPGLVEAPQPRNTQLCARFKQSHAHAFVSFRMGDILRKTIQQFQCDFDERVAEFGPMTVLEDFYVKESICKLIEEITANEWMRDIEGTSEDVEPWNKWMKEQAKREHTPRLRWYYTAWLCCESYMYRRLREIFELSVSLKHYDPFKSMKEESLEHTLEGMEMVASDWLQIIEQFPRPTVQQGITYQYFQMFLEMSLWGNRADLSYGGAKAAMSDMTGGHPLLRARSYHEYILVDEHESAWLALVNEDDERRRVDFIVESAAFELFSDMCLADFLITFRLADKVHFHVKSMPWFISDATVKDVERLVSFMAENRAKAVSAAKLAERWHDYMACGQWVVEADYCWTMPYDFVGIREECPFVYAKLVQASLLIVKGDFNFRKLTGDINWVPTQSFKYALRHFRPTNILSLRALKSDVVCGMQPGEAKKMDSVLNNWMTIGMYGTIQFAKQRPLVPGVPAPP